MNSGQDAQPNTGQDGGSEQSHQQQQQPQRPRVQLYRPEQMRTLPAQFSAEDKLKYEQGLRQLYSQIEKNPRDSPPAQEAKRKLFDFSNTLTKKLAMYRQQQQHQQQGQSSQQSGPSGPRPQSQGQPPAQNQGGDGGAANGNGNQQHHIPKTISPKLMEHVNSFPYVLPSNISPNTPESLKWINEVKQRYLKGLVTMESGSMRVSQLEGILKKREEEGKPLSPEEMKDWTEKKQAAQKSHSDAKQFVDNFRHSQQQQRNAANAANQHPVNSGSQGAGNGNGNGGNTLGNTNPTVGNTSAGVQGPPARPQMNPQQVPNPAAIQNTQTVNAAIEAAKNQQMAAAKPPLPQNGQMSQPSHMPSQTAPTHPNMPQQQSQQPSQPHIKMEGGGPPQLNTTVAQMQQARPMQNSPQSAVPRSATIPQSATSQSQQIPQALSHSDALHQAARSYSTPQINVMGHSHPQAPREMNTITSKLPIPKHLPERSTAPIVAVQMNQARPTYSGGPSNMGNGVLSQPPLAKTPGFTMEGEGDRVLSKKKLDELVKQVTGGGQGLEGGQGLTPDVEESILTVADNFVDQVLQAACKNAKERGSKVLEIRDIQLTLERGYNIRIPGYSSDEIRTVRKIQPSPAWIAKMSAVQAAKVTGGKNAD